MKKLTRLFLAFTFFTSCANSQPKNPVNEIVKITFENEINGYTVEVIWKPNSVRYQHTKGPAILTFLNKKESSSFTLANNNFSILNNRLPFSYNSDSSEILSLNENEITLLYDENNLEDEGSFGTTNEPFFFQDLDFDDVKELLLVEVNNGQRFVASFKAYKLEYSWVQEEMNGITYNEPYKSLDEMSEIDYKNKKIIIYKSGGNCANSFDIYKFVTAKNNYPYSWFNLETIIEQELDIANNRCFELKYKVINQTKQLISRTELK